METISMSREERRRLEVFSRVKSGDMSLAEAARLLGVSYRQAKRIRSRFGREGDAGLVHRLRGRTSNRKSTATLQERALTLYREQYGDYGPTLAAECLAKADGLAVSVSTLRRWLLSAGLWERRRKRRPHRRRRPRRERSGELVQLDGSYHDWFASRRGWAVLMVMIDDATGRVTAQFFEKESWAAAAEVFMQYVRQQGLPRALYVDQHSIYRPEGEPTAEQLLAGKEPETQFGRAMRELDVELILARSPQAKGRVERMNGTLQDRLVKALTRAQISDLEAANRFLRDSFLPEFNQQFAKAPAESEDWHRSLGAEIDLPRIVSLQEERVVANDWTVRWHNRLLQLTSDAADAVQPKGRVTVCEQLDGLLRVFAGARELNWTVAPEQRPAPVKKQVRTGPTGSSQGYKPPPNHPWKKRMIPCSESAGTPGPPVAAAPELACSAPAR